MKIGITSDLHLNFLSIGERDKLHTELRNSGIDRLVITGDIIEAKFLISTLMELVNETGLSIDFVLGNHDYYRGSIIDIRKKIEDFTSKHDKLNYLSISNPVQLTKRTYLIGHDGWCDGNAGDYKNSTFGDQMNDFQLIEEFIGIKQQQRLALMQVLAGQSTGHIIRWLKILLTTKTENIILATHVPPWPVATRYQGKISSDDTLPFYCCLKLGQAIDREMMAAWSNGIHTKLTIFCGHTHTPFKKTLSKNMEIVVIGSDYYKPIIKEVDIK